MGDKPSWDGELVDFHPLIDCAPLDRWRPMILAGQSRLDELNGHRARGHRRAGIEAQDVKVHFQMNEAPAMLSCSPLHLNHDCSLPPAWRSAPSVSHLRRDTELGPSYPMKRGNQALCKLETLRRPEQGIEHEDSRNLDTIERIHLSS